MKRVRNCLTLFGLIISCGSVANGDWDPKPSTDSAGVSQSFTLDKNFMIFTEPNPELGTDWAYFVNKKPIKVHDLTELFGQEYCAIASAEDSPVIKAFVSEEKSGLLFVKGDYVDSGKVDRFGVIFLSNKDMPRMTSKMEIYCAKVSSTMGLGNYTATSSDGAIARHLPKFLHPSDK
jgi:hypothetical protein